MMMRFREACLSKTPLWPKVEAFYDRTWGDFQMKQHEHTWCELMYVFSGACRISYGDEPPARLHTGDYIFLDAGVRHRLMTDAATPCTMLNVEFSFAESEDSLFSLQHLGGICGDFSSLLARHTPVLLGNDLEGQLFRAMDMLVLGLSSKEARDGALGQAEMMIFLMRLAQVTVKNRARVGAVRYVQQAVAFIQHNYAEKLSVGDIAAHAGISPDYLGHLFRVYLGETVLNYCIRVRNDHAATLLQRSGARLDDIALEVGFTSRQQLTRHFRAQFGMSPFAYRKRYRGRGDFR